MLKKKKGFLVESLKNIQNMGMLTGWEKSCIFSILEDMSKHVGATMSFIIWAWVENKLQS